VDACGPQQTAIFDAGGEREREKIKKERKEKLNYIIQWGAILLRDLTSYRKILQKPGGICTCS